jgi:hypothetical protein
MVWRIWRGKIYTGSLIDTNLGSRALKLIYICCDIKYIALHEQVIHFIAVISSGSHGGSLVSNGGAGARIMRFY